MKRGTDSVWTKLNVNMDVDGNFWKNAGSTLPEHGVAEAYTAHKYTGGARY